MLYSQIGARNNWALVPLRLMIGFGFAAHGYAKLSRGPQGFAQILQAIDVPLPSLAAWSTSLIEFVGGIALIAGVLVTTISIPLVIIMLVALLTIHLPYGFSSIKLMAVTGGVPQFGTPGYEMNLLYIAGLIALAFGGPGPYAIDNVLFRQTPTKGERC